MKNSVDVCIVFATEVKDILPVVIGESTVSELLARKMPEINYDVLAERIGSIIEEEGSRIWCKLDSDVMTIILDGSDYELEFDREEEDPEWPTRVCQGGELR